MRKRILGLIVSIGLVYAQSVIAADTPKNHKETTKTTTTKTTKEVTQKDAQDAPKHHPRHHAKHHPRHHHHHHHYYNDDYCDDDHYYQHREHRHHHGYHPHHHKHHHAKHIEKNPAAKSEPTTKPVEAKKSKQKPTSFHTQPSSKQLKTSYEESNSFQSAERKELASGLERSHR